ncbi:cytochrome c-type biogenesis protein CcmE [Spongiibacter sp. IMCC21906]|uniref:cytochrome c maturation protein CcmE n=1 Tax=Spongiibacter sp. IMCC21906 TaxID=1620392 RepID=UPI00062DD0E4|nr:cytochrome c maturation protein CcmE [Spongiibacter sp. IMCC21906]AKH69984.1 cytochrome c-type biogenesis protein CcmE [Spongiibacter sp. IMCC21906]
MHPVRKQRLMIVIFILLLVAVAAAFLGYALRENINLFYPPADIVAGKAPLDKKIRAGGMVQEGSIKRSEDSLKVQFVVTDFSAVVPVEYEGILPDLFAEGEGVVVSGNLGSDGVFYATQVLAKHDENYMPPEVSDALKKTEARAAAQAAAAKESTGT